MLPTAIVTFGTPTEDITCAVETATIRHGRDDPLSQPEADATTFDIWGPMPPGVNIGSPMVLSAVLDTITYPRFTGTVTDLSITWDTAPNLPVCQVIAVGLMARMGNRYTGAASMPAELDGGRANRVIALAGMPTDATRTDPGTIHVIARPPDNQPDLSVAQEAADDGGGELWQAKDGDVLYADAAHREGATIREILDPCAIPLDVTWTKNLDGLINDLTLGYYTQPPPVPIGHYGDTPTINIGTNPETCSLRIRLNRAVNLGGVRVEQGPGQYVDHSWQAAVLNGDRSIQLATGPITLVPGPMILTLLPVSYPLAANTDYWLQVEHGGLPGPLSSVGAMGLIATPFTKTDPFITPAAGDAFWVDSANFPGWQMYLELCEAAPPAAAELHETAPASITKYGTYQASMSTNIAGETDAIARATTILLRQSEPSWILSGVGINLELISKLDGITEADDIERTAAMLGLEIHDLVSITGLPYGSPLNPAYLFIEGWTESVEWGSWHIELATSDYCRTGALGAWDEADPFYTWNNYYETTTTWNNLPCTPPTGP